MARKRGRLFKYGSQRIVQNALMKIDAASQVWASNTKEGFSTLWAQWIETLASTLAATPFPEYQPGNLDANLRRVRAAVIAVREASRRYRAQVRVRAVAPPAVARVPA